MEQEQIDINLTELKKAVAMFWADPELKEKTFYKNNNGDDIMRTRVARKDEVAKKKDGSVIESETSVLHNTGFGGVSKQVGENEWENYNFINMSKWEDKGATQSIDDVITDNVPEEEDINPEDIPFQDILINYCQIWKTK